MTVRRRSSFLRSCALLTATVLCACHYSVSYAADKDDQSPIQVKVRVETKPEPTKAVGILLSTTGIREVSETSIEKVGEKLYDITFSVERSSLTDDTVATAMATSAEGQVAFANVTPALLSESHAITGSVPECPGDDPTSIAVLNQLGPLRQLVDVRTERSKFAREKLRRSIDESLLSRLSKFEKHFGLDKGKEPLTVDLPSEELLDRLSRINFALVEFKTFKKPGQSAGKSAN